MHASKGMDEKEVKSWIKAIQQRKALAIKEKMGHIQVNASVLHVNNLCERIFKNKLEREGSEQCGAEVMNPMNHSMI